MKSGGQLMKWQVLCEESTSGADFTIEADLQLSPLLKWCGILFMADSVTHPAKGYLFTLTEDGFTELLSLADGGSGIRTLQRRKSGILETNHTYHITVKMQNNICRIYIEDTASENRLRKDTATEAVPSEFAPWPVAELPLEDTGSRLAAVAAESGQAELSPRDRGDLCRNFHTGTLNPLPLPSPLPAPRYQNPVLSGYADPDILYHQGIYYLYATSSSLPAGYEAYTSRDLVCWEYAGKVMDEVWGMNRWYWAPDIICRNGKFYMLVSANEHLGICVSDSPLGPFLPEPGYLFDKSIDGHFFVDEDGEVYIFYVSWREGKTYALYAMRMEHDLVTPILSTETMVIKATETWEQQKAAVAEAPYVLKHRGKYYLTYSGSHFESAGYAVGYAIADTPLGPYAKYEGNPILSYHCKAHGPGHHCIVSSPDGRSLFIVYHTHHDTTTVQPRNICIDRLRFVPAKGKDDRLEVYGPTVTPQPYPLS